MGNAEKCRVSSFMVTAEIAVHVNADFLVIRPPTSREERDEVFILVSQLAK